MKYLEVDTWKFDDLEPGTFFIYNACILQKLDENGAFISPEKQSSPNAVNWSTRVPAGIDLDATVYTPRKKMMVVESVDNYENEYEEEN